METSCQEALNQYKDNKVNFRYSLFPQIYIPFYKELISSGRRGKEVPVLFIYNPFRKDKRFTTFTLDQNGKIKLVEGVDEEFAKKHEVWVISLNEKLKSREAFATIHQKKVNKGSARFMNGDYTSLATNCGDSDTYLIAPPASTGIRLNVYALQLFTHREPWYSGASEVVLELASAWGNGRIQTYPYTSYNTTGTIFKNPKWRGGSAYTYNRPGSTSPEFFNVSRSDVSSNTYFPNINYNATYDNRYSTLWGQEGDIRGDCLYYWFWEDDVVSADAIYSITSKPVLNPTTSPDYNTIQASVHSHEDPFAMGYIYFYTTPACFITISNPNGLRADLQLFAP